MGVFLNGQNKPLGEKEITEGTPTQATVYVRCVIEEARHFSTTAVVLVHNHPFGNPEPSAGEKDTTRTSDGRQVFEFRFPGCVTPHLIIDLKRKPNSEDLALLPPGFSRNRQHGTVWSPRRNGPMHELSIAQNIIEIVEQYVPGAAMAEVRSVRVRVGRLSGIVPDSLEFSFSAIVAGTPLGSARLDIEDVPAVCRCEACSAEFEAADFVFVCPACGNVNTRLLSGSDLQVVDIELEEAPVQEP